MKTQMYLFYIFVALFFTYGQATKMIESTQGIILSMFLANIFFVFFMSFKAYKIFKEERNFENFKIFSIYILGVILYGIISAIFVINKEGDILKIYDYINMILLLIIFILLYLFVSKDKMFDMSGAIIKSIPQIIFALTILIEGSGGVSWEMILSFHVLSIPRVFGTYTQMIKNEDNAKFKTLFCAEFFNEASWILVTLAFIFSWDWTRITGSIKEPQILRFLVFLWEILWIFWVSKANP